VGSNVDYDVGIIGGGPAGSSMAAYLARAGVRCAILEGDIFPREHVGESLVPAATRVFDEIGFLPTLDSGGFVRKYGATWSSGPLTRPYSMDWDGLGDDCHVAVRFAERDQPGVEQNYTYHVDRAKFDLALLQHAHAAGAKVYEGLKVRAVDFDGDQPMLRFNMGRRQSAISARMVIDASGRGTLLGRQLGLRQVDPVFRQYCAYTWFEGMRREDDNIHIHFLPTKGSWVWQIPISEKVTSVGVVTQRDEFAASKHDRQAFFDERVQTRPDLAAKLGQARQMKPLLEEADYSYSMSQVAGDQFMLLGDAARFIDPIFSSGVSIAVNSARVAIGDLLPALEHGDLSRKSFANFETTIGRAVKNWYDFICLYYRLNVLFTRFVHDPAHRLDVLKLLQGDVHDEERPAVLRKMQEKVREVEGNPQHMWHGLLNDMTREAVSRA
jgi:flavin-dependent dehydrogenase